MCRQFQTPDPQSFAMYSECGVSTTCTVWLSPWVKNSLEVQKCREDLSVPRTLCGNSYHSTKQQKSDLSQSCYVITKVKMTFWSEPPLSLAKLNLHMVIILHHFLMEKILHYNLDLWPMGKPSPPLPRQYNMVYPGPANLCLCLKAWMTPAEFFFPLILDGRWNQVLFAGRFSWHLKPKHSL